LDAHKGKTNYIYNGSEEDYKMHDEDTKSLGEIFVYQEIFNVLEQKKYVTLIWQKISNYSKSNFLNFWYKEISNLGC
jgi:hypothetical protein